MRVKLDFGSEVDLLTAREVADILATRDAKMRAELAGKKYRPRVRLSGYAVGGELDIGGDAIATIASGPMAGQPAWNGQPVGPTQGYAWAIRRMIINGLTASATAPDVANFYLQGGDGNPDWQLNGNQWGETFSWGEMCVMPGETVRLASLGTFAATGLITLKLALVQVPAERLGELV